MSNGTITNIKLKKTTPLTITSQIAGALGLPDSDMVDVIQMTKYKAAAEVISSFLNYTGKNDEGQQGLMWPCSKPVFSFFFKLFLDNLIKLFDNVDDHLHIREAYRFVIREKDPNDHPSKEPIESIEYSS